MSFFLVILALLFAAIPCIGFAVNLGVYRRLPRLSLGLADGTGPAAIAPSGNHRGHESNRTLSLALELSLGLATGIRAPELATESVSVLIPARNEELNLRRTLEAVLANPGAFELIVLDDHSTDRTLAISRQFEMRDPRVRVVSAPALPAGWCGKPHACHVLAGLAQRPLLLFMDADVRLAPDAIARLGRLHEASSISLASGIPRQELQTFSERLLIPLIHFMLLGFLPIPMMRRSSRPAFGAGCGQLFVARADAYWRAGGHASIRGSLHDGLTLPRLFRRAGLRTDLFDATDLATCRMYRTDAETWQGLGKNAVEGMAAPRTLLPFTVMLLCGQVLPLGLLACGIVADPALLPAGLLATGLSYLPRLAAARRFHQPLLSALLHPFGVLGLLAIQWAALLRHLRGRPAVWRGRAYSVATAGDRRPGSAMVRDQGVLAGHKAKTTAVLLAAAMSLGSLLAATAQDKRLSSFTLNDQFEQAHTFRFPSSNVVVIAAADRKGSPDVDGWTRPIVQRYGKSIQLAGVADMSKVPAFLRSIMRERFAQEQRVPVMIDWDGRVTRLLGCRKEQANLFVLDGDGRVAWQFSGPASPSSLDALFAAVDRARAKLPRK
jgi:hypothetical protein